MPSSITANLRACTEVQTCIDLYAGYWAHGNLCCGLGHHGPPVEAAQALRRDWICACLRACLYAYLSRSFHVHEHAHLRPTRALDRRSVSLHLASALSQSNCFALWHSICWRCSEPVLHWHHTSLTLCWHSHILHSMVLWWSSPFC